MGTGRGFGGWRWFASGLAAVLLLASVTLATPPNIYLVESSDGFTFLHFDMDAGRSYTVQYRDSMSSGTWSNLATVPTFPFPNHWIYSDLQTNRVRRFYRLSVTP